MVRADKEARSKCGTGTIAFEVAIDMEQKQLGYRGHDGMHDDAILLLQIGARTFRLAPISTHRPFFE